MVIFDNKDLDWSCLLQWLLLFWAPFICLFWKPTCWVKQHFIQVITTKYQEICICLLTLKHLKQENSRTRNAHFKCHILMSFTPYLRKTYIWSFWSSDQIKQFCFQNSSTSCRDLCLHGEKENNNKGIYF